MESKDSKNQVKSEATQIKPAVAPKPAAAPKPAQKTTAQKVADAEKISKIKGIKNAFIVILICLVFSVCFFIFVMGGSFNFEGGDNANAPIPDGIGHWLGVVYKGGVIVPILMTLLLTVIVLSIERAIAINSAMGSGNTTKFVTDIKMLLAQNKIDEAMQRCRQQKGSVAAVVFNTLVKYKELDANKTLSKEQKLTTLRNEVEEATALEMPSLSENLPIIATLTTLGTLVGLLGTVLGMIKSFSALASSGSPDSTELSNGISEALVNTALGISTGALAVIFYNFFTNKIDNLTYAIDEIGFSIVATFAATHE